MQTIITLDDKKFNQNYYNAAHVETIDDSGIRQNMLMSMNFLMR